ncbi:MAG: enoyl-CoA hydratase/isomerase family protein [FCB group bacterium]|nr:enoyl-CoA hydratase/isomerase family protein [FCB group bacterium]
MSYETITVEVKDSVGRLTFNRPKYLNAYSQQMSDELVKGIDQLANDPAARVIVITGAGQAFMAGADIGGMLKGWAHAEGGAAEVEEILSHHFAPTKLEQCPKPVIGAINGFAFGFGCEIAIGCDIRICTQSAQFAQPEITLGIMTGGGGSQRLPHLVGYGKAVEMVLTGDPITADEALKYGLVTQVVPDDQLEEAVAVMVKKLLKKSDTALRLSKEVLVAALNNGLYDGVAQEVKTFASIFESKDAKEGIAAFLEKRRPEFNKG